MPRPDLNRVPEWYHGYINLVKGDDFVQAMRHQTTGLSGFLGNIPGSKKRYCYAPGKWTVQEVLQHMIDAERVFSYRALCFARKDKTHLPPFDENEYSQHSKANGRDWREMQEEFISLRKASEYMFSSFDEDQIAAIGIANNSQISVLDLGFIMVGHVAHHINIIQERYL